MIVKWPIVIHDIEKFGTLEFSERMDSFYRKWLDEYPVDDYIYIIRDRDVTHYYKIGRTIKPAMRLKNFDVKLPFDIYIIAIIPVFNGHQYEQHFHSYFQHKRVSGEWFNLQAEDIMDLKMIELRYPTLTMQPIQWGDIDDD